MCSGAQVTKDETSKLTVIVNLRTKTEVLQQFFASFHPFLST